MYATSLSDELKALGGTFAQVAPLVSNIRNLMVNARYPGKFQELYRAALKFESELRLAYASAQGELPRESPDIVKPPSSSASLTRLETLSDNGIGSLPTSAAIRSARIDYETVLKSLEEVQPSSLADQTTSHPEPSR